jgi:hypothetical protein
MFVSASQKTYQSGSANRRSGAECVSQHACFVRWAVHGGSSAWSEETHPGKVEARCRECGASFVKYVYEKTVRCMACRCSRRNGFRENGK